MSEDKKKNWIPYLMVLPALAVMLLVVIYPILDTIARSFVDSNGGLTMKHYVYFITTPAMIESFGFTLVEALITMTLGIILSFLLALYIRFSKSKISRIIGKLYMLPRFIPGIAAVYAVMNVIRDSGTINRFFKIFGIDFKPGLLYDMKGIVLSNLWFTIPFSTMLLCAALSAVNDSYIESARDLGSSRWNILKNIILPLVIKDVVIAATFILMGQIGSFTIPYLTGPNNPKMLGIVLYQQTTTYMDYNRAAALTVMIFLLCLVSTVIYIKTNMKEYVWESSK